ncbi:methyltransferase domain-containing protein [Myxococcota bacterium]|nr:methyltransferase domain-containing protein [Myxococcota bacterium]MBU1898419.1 methyltransferase domain-containing protein [Myxococcota bacterium]
MRADTEPTTDTEPAAEIWTEAICRAYTEQLRGVIRFDHRRWAKRVDRALGVLREGAVILDVASGPGFLLFELARLRPQLTLIAHDLSPHMGIIQREEARQRGLEIEAIGGPAEAIERASATVDVVTCKQLLHECADVAQTLAEIHRVLKPGGVAFIIDFDQDGSRLAARLIHLFMRLRRGGVIADSFWRSYSAGFKGSDIKAKLEAVGFEPVIYHRSGPNYMMIARRAGADE